LLARHNVAAPWLHISAHVNDVSDPESDGVRPRLQGPFTLSKVFLPVLEATLSKQDEQPDVLVQALHALTRLLSSNLIPIHSVLVPVHSAPPRALHLLLHPSTAVRQAAVELFCTVAERLDVPDLYALLRPALQHALRGADRDLNPLLFSDASVVSSHLPALLWRLLCVMLLCVHSQHMRLELIVTMEAPKQ
jgi:hypothetical protein